MRVFPVARGDAAWVVPHVAARGRWRDLAGSDAGRWHQGDAPHDDVQVELRGALLRDGDEVEVWGVARAPRPDGSRGYRERGEVDAFDAVVVGVGPRGAALARAIAAAERPRGRAIAALVALAFGASVAAVAAARGAVGAALPALPWVTLAGGLWVQARGALSFVWPGRDDARLWLVFGAFGAVASTLWTLSDPTALGPAAVALAAWALLAAGAWSESRRDARAEATLAAPEGVERVECVDDDPVMPLRGRVTVARADGERVALSLNEIVWATTGWTRHRDHRGGFGWYPAFMPGATLLCGGLSPSGPWRPRVMLAAHGADPEALLARAVAWRRALAWGLLVSAAAALTLGAARWRAASPRATTGDVPIASAERP